MRAVLESYKAAYLLLYVNDHLSMEPFIGNIHNVPNETFLSRLLIVLLWCLIRYRVGKRTSLP